jgi:hypothetical protein
MALIGVFVLALPVPIVVNRFADFSNNYKNRLWRNEVLMKKQQQDEHNTANYRNGDDQIMADTEAGTIRNIEKPNGTLEMESSSKVTQNQLKS